MSTPFHGRTSSGRSGREGIPDSEGGRESASPEVRPEPEKSAAEGPAGHSVLKASSGTLLRAKSDNSGERMFPLRELPICSPLPPSRAPAAQRDTLHSFPPGAEVPVRLKPHCVSLPRWNRVRSDSRPRSVPQIRCAIETTGQKHPVREPSSAAGAECERRKTKHAAQNGHPKLLIHFFHYYLPIASSILRAT